MVEKVSVIIPTKDRIDATLRSLKSVINQTLTPSEIIVVDDGSRDGTYTKIKDTFRDVKIVRNEISRGGAVARNQGANLATGDFIAFLDSDDEWLPQHLENKIGLIKSNNSEGSFGTFILQKGKAENSISFHTTHHLNGNIGNSILSAVRFDARTSTFVMRREAFLKIQFDEKLKKHQDWDLAINFDEYFKLVLDKEPTVRIFIEQKEERMSQKLQHESSFYFINKNAHYLDADNIFMFCIKQIMRSQLANEPNEVIKRYLNFSKQYLKQINFQNKIIFYLLNSKIINIGSLYQIRNKFKKKLRMGL